MADDINPMLRAQLINDRDAEAPRIRGLPDVAATSISDDAKAAVAQQLAVRVRRRDLIQVVLDDLDRARAAVDALENDGWPNPVSLATVNTALFTELQGEQSDVQAAVALFRQEAAITLDVANATLTSQPAPEGNPGP